MLIELTERLLVCLFAVVLTPIFNPHVTTTRNHKPHQPWHVPQYFYDQYTAGKIPLPTNAFAPKNVPDIAFTAELDGQNGSALYGTGHIDNSPGAAHFLEPIPGNNTFPDWFTSIMRAGYYSALSMAPVSGLIILRLAASPSILVSLFMIMDDSITEHDQCALSVCVSIEHNKQT